MIKIKNDFLKIYLFFNIVVYVFILLYLLNTNYFFDRDFLLIIITNVIFVTILFFLREERNLCLKNQLFRISVIFVLGYLIVFFQIYIDYLLGNFDFTFKRFWINENIILKSSMISSLGLFSFYLGYILNNKKINNKKEIVKANSLLPYKILSTLLLVIFYVTINPLYLLGGYGKFDIGNTARYASILFELSIVALIVQNIINFKNFKVITIKEYLKSFGFYFYLIVILYLIGILMSGDRGPIMYMSIGILSSFIILTKIKFSILKIFILLMISSIFISSLVKIRTNKDSSKSTIEIISEGFLDSKKKSYGYADLENVESFSGSTLELATSIRVFHIVTDYIPKNENFFYGRFQILQIITIFPLGQNVFKEIFNIPEEELTSAAFATYLGGGVNGEFGTTCLTDIYLDFGVFGVIVCMLFFGIYIRYLENSIFNSIIPKTLILISFIVFCQYAIYIPRSTIMFNFRNIIWVYFIIKFIQLISINKNNYANNKK